MLNNLVLKTGTLKERILNKIIQILSCYKNIVNFFILGILAIGNHFFVAVDGGHSLRLRLSARLFLLGQILFEQKVDGVAILARVVDSAAGRQAVASGAARFLIVAGHTLRHAPIPMKNNEFKNQNRAFL